MADLRKRLPLDLDRLVGDFTAFTNAFLRRTLDEYFAGDRSAVVPGGVRTKAPLPRLYTKAKLEVARCCAAARRHRPGPSAPDALLQTSALSPSNTRSTPTSAPCMWYLWRRRASGGMGRAVGACAGSGRADQKETDAATPEQPA